MLLSIIIPAYNTGEMLKQCVDSIITQETDSLEIILVDDGSTDEITYKICDEYARCYPELIHTIHTENGGPGKARNIGIKMSKGEYLGFIDSDDFLTEGSIAVIKKAIRDFSADAVQLGYKLMKDGIIIDDIGVNLPPNQFLCVKEYPHILTMTPSVWTRIWRKTLFTENNIWFPEKVWYEDFRTSIKLLLKAESIVSVPFSHYVYRQRTGSIMHNGNIEKNRDILAAFDDLIGWFKSNHLYETYYNILSKMAVYHIFVFGGVRVAQRDPGHPLLRDFQQYMQFHFPGYMKNPELNFRALPPYYKLMILLMHTKNYRIIWLLYKMKGS